MAALKTKRMLVDDYVKVSHHFFSIRPEVQNKIIPLLLVKFINWAWREWLRASRFLTKISVSSLGYGKNPSWKGCYSLRCPCKLSREISPLVESGQKLLVVGKKNIGQVLLLTYALLRGLKCPRSFRPFLLFFQFGEK